ncbi:hypothetical protein BN2364_2096 [Alloalcanivorax xenomutans]|uniref:Ig-like domain-containing protein n=1 Tax=Alloalcanivorax xenomutans TaxID=1094342 RepID=UPI0006D5C2CD|nr:Ig-like domain-containing protein [Alloalcanivorax xenomutans]PHS71887.1 MAG: hypothetical protein COB00_02170 [Alcanivorax sp.]CUR46537.1 hypothetical protein BN2364_2096 [Alloalcanivorax xenomutans]
MIRGTFNRTLYGTLLITACATVLTACGGSDGSDMPGNDANDAQRQSLLYAYPDDGQAEVPTKAPVVLRFTSDVSLGDVEQSVTLCCDAEGGNLDYTAETVGPDPRGVILTPAQSLSPLTDYTIAIKNLRLRNGTSADRTLRFTTRPLAEGPRSLVVKDDGFAIDRQMPNGDTNEPIMDFSSFRFQFTQPVDRASARYGDTVVLTDSSGETVEATLLINGHYMTVDPKPEYLTPGQSYTLSLTNGLTSTFDEAFAGTEINFTPADSSPRGEPAMLVQRITQSGLSRLTGKNINQVPVNGTLLGEDVNVTQASADAVVAELADVTEYPDVTPIRLPRGTKLTGSAIEMVMIGGEVPAGFGSGPVDMRLTSDATGYLVPNPYNVHNRADALRIVHLLMDVGIATEDPRANGGFTQDIMHIELVGVAEVDTEAGVLNLDAVGMVEPNILGQEYGHGLLSFQLQSYKDQMNTPTAPEDKTGPTLQSWTLGTDTLTGEDKSLLAKPGDPIILNFDEALDGASLNKPGALSLTKDGAAVDFEYYLDGASVVIQPEGGLQYEPISENPEYVLQLGGEIEDVTGNSFMPKTLTFQLPGQVTARNRPNTNTGEYSAEPVQINSPALLSAYPGYPCVTDPDTRDLAGGIVGRCVGGMEEGWTSEYPLSNHQSDDNLPLMSLPEDQPIVLQFSKPIDPSSVKLGGSFNVIRVNSAGDPVDEDGVPTSNPTTVQGELAITGQSITFVPNEPWTIGQIYKYTLGSNNDTGQAPQGPGYIGSKEANCDGTESICSSDGLPLRTQPLGLVQRHPITTPNTYGGRVVADHYLEREYFIVEGGGPDLDIFFKGDKRNTAVVVQTFRTMPDADPNGNLIHEVDAITDKLSQGSTVSGYYNEGILISSYDENGYRLAARYDYQEPLPSAPDLNADPIHDPDGVLGLPNSAKILSLNVTGSVGQDEIPWMLEGTNSPFMVLPLAILGVDGGNIGCGYESVFDPATGEEIEVPTTPSLNVIGSNPVSCPERKFTYIKMGLNATVTDEYVAGKGIKVMIWPSQALATSIMTYARNPIGGFPTIMTQSGDQLMRMRYAKDDPSCVPSENTPCSRTQPIAGWINNDGNGNPTLTADVDLYVDLPFLSKALRGINVRHNLSSYPINMILAGPVTFLDDGRMVVQQRNLNPVNIDLKTFANAAGGIAGGRLPMQIPVEGTFLQMVSTPIKLLPSE